MGFVEIESDKGHDSFLLDVPDFLNALKNFLDSRGKLKKRTFKKGDIIFWKGHVAICLNSKKLIHAYGPEKKVLMMPIIKTINRIRETANLEVKKIATWVNGL